MTTRTEYATVVLREGGFATEQAQIEALVVGMTAEDSHAEWNPLDTEERFPGSTDYNSAGVQNYATFDDGVAAVLRTLALGIYAPLRGLLRSPQATTLAILKEFQSTWCAGNDLWVRVYEGGFDLPTSGAVEVTGSAPAPAPADPTPPPAPAPLPTPEELYVSPRLPIIRPGDRGYPVRILQRILQSGLVEDGVYGPATETVVKAWMTSKGFVPDGVIGLHSWESLIGQVVNGV